MGFNLGACAFRVSSLLYLMRLRFYFLFLLSFFLTDDRGRVWGHLLRYTAGGVLKTQVAGGCDG